MSDSILSTIDLISALSLIFGAVGWGLVIYFKSRITKRQSRILAGILFLSGIACFVISAFVTALTSLTVTAVVFCGLSFISLRAKKSIADVKGTPSFKTDEEQAEHEKQLAGKYDEDMKFGVFHFKNGEFNKARDKFIHAIKLKENAAEPWYYIGLINLAIENYENAVISFKRVLDLDMNHEQAKTKLELAKTKFEAQPKKKRKKLF